MPDRKIHLLFDKLILGEEHPEVHKFKDAPAKLLGPKHRIYFHDHTTNLLLGVMYGPKAFLSGELHDMLDKHYTQQKRKTQKRRKRR